MYDKKSAEYFSNVRLDIVGALNGRKFDHVLELGAGGCNTLFFLKEKGLAQTVTGVELFAIEDSNQNHPLIDEVHIASIEQLIDLPLKKHHFNLVICGDVLEHVFDPWSILNQVKTLMADDGIIICSMPNFREFQTMKKVFFKGDFRYNPEGGILDKTHMRFFCKKNIVELFEESGFDITAISPAYKWAASQKKRLLAHKLSLGLLEEFVAFQYLVEARLAR